MSAQESIKFPKKKLECKRKGRTTASVIIIIEGVKKDFQHATKIKSIDLYIYLHTYMYTYKNKVNVF